jgi:glycosyltransferase involved in cell wall biosynthesis
MNPKVSVIIPVYNVEKYLHRCIDSVLNQSLQDFEIILVNDGSTDSSPEICDEYAQKDERISVIHKKNARVAAARNDGIKAAKGEFISLIDSDDWIEPTMLEEMYSTATQFNCDFVMCDFTKKGKGIEYTVSQPISEGFYNRERIEKELFKCLIMFENIEFPPTISNWTCLFNREFLINKELYYDEDIHYCEDSIFGSKVMYNANKFYYLKGKYFYNYFYNPNSTTSKYNPKKWESYLKINERLEEYFKNNDFDFSYQLKINMLYFALNMMSEIGRSNESFLEKRRYCKKVITNKRVRTIFKDFRMPDVSFGLKIVINLIKYRCSWIYSAIFYKNKF